MMPFLQLAGGTLAFALCLLLAWPLAARIAVRPVDRIVASAVLSLALLWCCGFAIYLSGVSWKACYLLLPLSVAAAWTRRRDFFVAMKDPDVRALVVAQGVVAAWCLGWQLLVQSYSGGGWSGDWVEHWQRAQFFLEREPLDRNFLGHYALTARPPLANVVTAVLLAMTASTFWMYQWFTTILSTLVFLPTAALALQWNGKRRTIALFAVLAMLSPLVVQNSTFTWTKLPAAFAVISAVYFFRENTPLAAASRGFLVGASLATSLLIHYSAAPYAIALAIAWFTWRERVDMGSHGKATLVAAITGALLLTTWFGWAVTAFGWHGVVMTNSSVTTTASTFGGQIARIALNLRDTVVPHFLRGVPSDLIAQASPWGYARDWFFQLYQLNLVFALGCIGWLVAGRELRCVWKAAPPAARNFWLLFVSLTVVLGVAVVGERDRWGLTHVCLQPLVVVALAFIASRWDALSASWRRVVLAGCVVDFCAGIALHFAVQNFAFDRWLTPGRPAMEVLRSYSLVTLPNAYTLASNGLTTLNETFANPVFIVVPLLAALLIFALYRTRRT